MWKCNNSSFTLAWPTTFLDSQVLLLWFRLAYNSLNNIPSKKKKGAAKQVRHAAAASGLRLSVPRGHYCTLEVALLTVLVRLGDAHICFSGACWRWRLALSLWIRPMFGLDVFDFSPTGAHCG